MLHELVSCPVYVHGSLAITERLPVTNQKANFMCTSFLIKSNKGSLDVFCGDFQALSNALCVFILFVSEVKENIP